MRYSLFLTTLAVLLQIACESETTITENILPSRVSWEVISNVEKEQPASLVAFTFYNDSDQSIDGSNWELFYNQTNRHILNNLSDVVTVEQIVGDFYRLSPSSNFKIAAGDSIKVQYECAAWLIKETDAPHGLYWNIKDTDGSEKQMAVENYKVLPFKDEAQVSRHKGDKTPTYSAAQQYKDNEYLSVLPSDSLNDIIPTPVSTQKGNGKITLDKDFKIQYVGNLENEATHLKNLLQSMVGLNIARSEGEEKNAKTISLQLGGGLAEKAESYRLGISENAGIQVIGKDAAGVFYGIQSLLSLLPIENLQDKSASIELPEIRIQDTPRFPYRGMHLDVGRNFQQVAAVKKLIDAMAFYKLNKLHLHLTEDEGWRLEIEDLPELTAVGSRRGHTLDSKENLPPSYGSGFDPNDKKSNGNGYYTRDDFKSILQYAHERHIEVIPEINMPGHARAAIKAMENRYRKYMLAGDTLAANQYLLSDFEDQSEYASVQDFPDNVVCVCKESVYTFYEKVVEEVAEMYTEANVPLKTIHTGGDEVPNGVWTNSPICTELMREIPELNTPIDLSTYFIGRINDILYEKNLITAGWEEIAMKKVMKADSTYTYIAHPDFINSNMLPYVWQNLWGNQDLGYRLANAGYPVILCNVTNFYFDLAYNKDPKEPGFYWGGFIDTRKPYEVIPYDMFKSTKADPMGNPFNPEKDYEQMERLRPDAQDKILGIQGELWSETVKGGDMLEYYYLPKMMGLAERAWAVQPDWAKMEDQVQREQALDTDWNIFANTIAQRDFPRLASLSGGYNYRIPTPGSVIKDDILYVNSSLPGLIIRYTTDGSEPIMESPLYEKPIEVSGTVKVKAFDRTGKSSRVVEVDGKVKG